MFKTTRNWLAFWRHYILKDKVSSLTLIVHNKYSLSTLHQLPQLTISPLVSLDLSSCPHQQRPSRTSNFWKVHYQRLKRSLSKNNPKTRLKLYKTLRLTYTMSSFQCTHSHYGGRAYCQMYSGPSFDLLSSDIN